MAQTNLNLFGVVMIAFITILLGTILVDVIGDSVFDATNTINAYNDSTAISSGTGQLDNTGVIALLNFSNHTTDYTSAIDGENITFTRAGVVSIDASVVPDNQTYNISYTYEPSTYVRGSAVSRTLITLIVIFFAIAVVTAGILMVRRGFKDFF